MPQTSLTSDNTEKMSPPPKTSQRRRIAHTIGFSITAFGIILLVVSGLSLSGLNRFQSALSDLTDTTLHNMVHTAANSTQISQLVLQAERLRYANTEIERRLAYKDIRKQFSHITDLIRHAPLTGAPHPSPQLAALDHQLGILYDLAGQRLNVKDDLRASLTQFDAMIAMISSLPMHGAHEHDTAQYHDIMVRLVALLSRYRETIIAQKITAPYQMRQTIRDELETIKARLPAHHSHASTQIDQALQETESFLLDPNGFIRSMIELIRIRSEMISVTNIARGMISDMSAAQVTQFNTLINRADTLIAQITYDSNLFARLLTGVVIAAILIAFGLFVYFRKAFVIRLENLNRAVLDRVTGQDSIIDTRGHDEIATIAQSINYFATEISISRDSAEASNRTKSEFLANMSHEIRTPMNAIIGFSRMTLETDLSAPQREHIEKIATSASFLLSIINDILDFSKIEAGKLDIERIPFDLRQTIESVSSVSSPKAQTKKLDFSIDLDDAIPSVLLGDPVRIFQILNNLCDNAIKFTAHGSVAVRITLNRENEQNVWLTFSVSDQGIGLTPEQRGRIFQPFTQADASTTRQFGGTGLGLVICRRLCELMGGMIDVDSAYGRGSTFSFTLPLGRTTLAALNMPQQDTVTHEKNLNGVPILLVEDNEINQEIALFLLEKSGATIDIAANGQEAVDKVQTKRYALIFMDIQMPEMDGITATGIIRTLPDPWLSEVPIVAMTAHAMESDRRKSLAAGMNDHIVKPLDPDAVYAMLEKWIPDPAPHRS